MSPNQPLNIITLMKECSVHLLYLCDMKFGTLRWQPHNPRPVQPKPNLGKFNIVEEYILDKQTTSGESSTAKNNEAEHVEMVHQKTDQCAIDAVQISSRSVLLPEEPTDQKEENVHAFPVETTDDEMADTLLPRVSTSSPTPVISKEPKILIPRLSNTDIDIWTDNVHTHYSFIPVHVGTDSKPEISKVRGYGCHSTEHHSDTRIKEEVSQYEPVPKKTCETQPS